MNQKYKISNKILGNNLGDAIKCFDCGKYNLLEIGGNKCLSCGRCNNVWIDSNEPEMTTERFIKKLKELLK